MRLPMQEGRVNRELAIPMIHRAFEAGVNYIDTAVGYCGADSQRAVGEALKGWRDRIVVSTKNHYYGEDEKQWWKNLEDSLERLQVDCIDIYNTHGVSIKSYEANVRPRVSQWLNRARDQGLIRHICTSFHDNNDALRRILEDDYYASVTLQYNMLDRQLEDAIALAHERNVGVVVMGPVGGGRLGTSNPQLQNMVPGIDRIPELALRFVLANPHVTVALSGMSTMAHVEENLRVASDGRSLDSDERRLVDEQLQRLKAMADAYCTGCNYCQPCPEKVNIPRVFRLYNDARVYGFHDAARKDYARWAKQAPKNQLQADACTECGLCEEKCPQHIPIREQLKQAHALLQTSAPQGPEEP
jgi:predicted aldo/keto reductase-like oxidoreductase